MQNRVSAAGSLGSILLLLNLSLKGEHLLRLGSEGREHLGELVGSRRYEVLDRIVDGWQPWGGWHINIDDGRRPGGVLSFKVLRRPEDLLSFFARKRCGDLDRVKI